MMKRFRIVILLGIFASIPSALRAQGQQPTAASEISASGSAEIRVAPDHAVVMTTAESRDRSATAATASNGLTVNAIMQALRKAGLPATAVSTSNFSVDQYFPPRFDPRESQVPDGFITRTVIRAETDNVATVSGLIDAALTAGATRIGVSFSSTKLADARRRGLEAAFSAAKSDAAALAQAAGGTLGRLLAVSPNGASPATLFRSPADYIGVVGGIATGTAAAMIAPGNVTSNVVVTARWEFLPAGSR
jgi:uncharacterized protein YggE